MLPTGSFSRNPTSLAGERSGNPERLAAQVGHVVDLSIFCAKKRNAEFHAEACRALTLPGRDHSHSPSTREHMCTPRTPLTVVAYVIGPDRRLPGFYETILGSISTCSSRAFQQYHSRVRQPPPWLSGFESGVRTRCARPFSPPPFALTAAQPSARAPPHVCCVQPKHPCIACRTHSAQAVPLPLPEHAHTHRPALSPSRGRCTRFRSGLATPWVRGDLLWRDLYVRVGVISTVPCTSSVAAVCRCELLSAVVFSRVAGAWLMVARVCYSSVYF